MKLYVKINDKLGGYERVELCQFKDKDNNDVFVEEVTQHDDLCFKVLIDEGYVRTYYYYPVQRYVITEVEVLQ